MLAGMTPESARPIRIRPAQLADLSAIQACAEAAYGKYVERIGRKPAPMTADYRAQILAGIVHVLDTDNTIAGFAVFYPRGDHLHLENVAVHPDFRGKGHGARLITQAEQFAAASGARAVELYTNAKMTENMSIYPRLGFVEIGRRNEDGFDRVYFRKALPAGG